MDFSYIIYSCVVSPSTCLRVQYRENVSQVERDQYKQSYDKNLLEVRKNDG